MNNISTKNTKTQKGYTASQVTPQNIAEPGLLHPMWTIISYNVHNSHFSLIVISQWLMWSLNQLQIPLIVLLFNLY